MLHDDDVVDDDDVVKVEVKVEVNNLQCLRQNMDQICQRLLLFGLIVLYGMFRLKIGAFFVDSLAALPLVCTGDQFSRLRS